MIQRNELLSYLEEFLKTKDFDDYCINGLQVEGCDTITRITVGVSVSQVLFDRAIKTKSDMILVHHGLFWRGSAQPFHLTGIMKQRVKMLLDNNINLTAYHLPLDAHPEVGNNAQLLKKMKLPCSEPFEVGYMSNLSDPVSATDLKQKLDDCLPDPSAIYGDVTGPIRSVAIVSGGGAGFLEKAWKNGADALISGEISEPSVRLAEEMGICFLCAGHYNSERPGPIALADHLEKTFGLKCEFVDVPNPV